MGESLAQVCSVRPAFLNLAREQQGLDKQLDIILKDIKDVLYSYAQVPVPPRPKSVKITRAGMPLNVLLPPELRIIELPEFDVLSNYPYYPLGKLRGLYDYSCGKIFLSKDHWCRETLIHEALHSVSFFGAVMYLKKFTGFFDGLTEFFVGYILYLRYPECYKAWKNSIQVICSVTYLQCVKLFASFCRFVPIKELSNIYFWNGTTNWEGCCHDFIAAIHKRGYLRFPDFIQMSKPTLQVSFLQNCRKVFGKQFDRIYYGPNTNALDFIQMLQ